MRLSDDVCSKVSLGVKDMLRKVCMLEVVLPLVSQAQHSDAKLRTSGTAVTWP
jgi:hypothetical protein